MKQKSSPVDIISKFVNFPLTRIVLGFLLLAVVVILAEAGRDAWTKHKNDLADLLLICVAVVASLLVYAWFVRLTERRPVTELSLKYAWRELFGGAAIGAVLFILSVGILWALGFYRVSGMNSWTVIVSPLAVAIFHGVYEELLVRGVIFRIMEESLGTWLALGISALVFGLMHIGNPNATLWGAAAIAIEAGITLAAAYVLSRRLWIPIGIHIAWNFVQGGIFNVAVSGIEVKGLFNATLTGPALLSGGEFGAEASVLVVAASLAVSGYFLWRSWEKGNILRPFWQQPEVKM